MGTLVQSYKGRNLLFYLLYISEGAPIGFIWWALPTLLGSRGVPVDKIAELGAILVLPWALKILWAPLLDVFQFQRWNLRAWIICTQLFMGLTMLPLAYLDFAADFSVIRTLLLCHAVFAASQDVCIDSWAIKTTPKEQLGRMNSFMQLGVLSGRWFFASGYLVFSKYLSQAQLIYILVAVIWSTALVVWMTPDPVLRVTARSKIRVRLQHFTKNLWTVLQRKTTWAGLGFALLSGAGFHGATAVMGPYLVERGFSENSVGHFFSFNLLGLFLGSLAGGYLADRFGCRRMAGTFLVLLASIVFAIAGLEEYWRSPMLIYGLFQLLHFGIGLFTVASYGMLMEITDHDVSATQFSTFMGAVNACESWTSTAFASLYRAQASYALNFAALSAVSLFALLVLPILKRLQSKTESARLANA
jgi:MFS family permease